jgi:hypothetical protein
MEIKLHDLIEWVLDHPKREQAFTGWSNDQIMQLLIQACRDDELYTTVDKTGINGIIVADIDKSKRVIHINHILTIKPVAFQAFILKYFTSFSGYTVTGKRGARMRTYTQRDILRGVNTEYLEIIRPISKHEPAIV